jgi:hypothetical protein
VNWKTREETFFVKHMNDFENFVKHDCFRINDKVITNSKKDTDSKGIIWLVKEFAMSRLAHRERD